MANEQQINLIFGGIKGWNEWREENRNKHEETILTVEESITSHKKINLSLTILPSDLAGADLSDTDLQRSILDRANLTNANLTKADLRNAKLSGAILHGADLRNADFRNADLSNADLTGTKLHGAHFSDASLSRTNLRGSDLRGGFFDDAYFDNADLSEANLSDAHFLDASFSKALLNNANLRGADLRGADMSEANLQNADLTGADLSGADFTETNLQGALLRGANLQGAKLIRSNLSEADLSKADLRAAILVETNIAETTLTGCSVYGLSAWNMIGAPKDQSNLIISLVTKSEDAVVTVDDINIAQFIFLLISNQKIKNVITTITSKAVLILGRFYEERKKVLDALRDDLRKRDLVPIIFDFEPSENRDITETIQLLANMSKFIIADITDARSIPQELSHIVPFLPSVPVRPILLEKEKQAYSMFEHWEKFKSVLPIFYYRDKEDLISNIEIAILKPVENWKKNRLSNSGKDKIIEENNKTINELLTTNKESQKKLEDLTKAFTKLSERL